MTPSSSSIIAVFLFIFPCTGMSSVCKSLAYLTSAFAVFVGAPSECAILPLFLIECYNSEAVHCFNHGIEVIKIAFLHIFQIIAAFILVFDFYSLT